MTIRALLFDLNDTLWHLPVRVPPMQYHQHAAAQIAPLLERWGIDADPLDLAQRLLAAVERVTEEAASTSLLAPFLPEAVVRVCDELRLRLDDEQIQALGDAWYVEGVRVGRRAYPDAVTTLRWARDAGFQTGIVANRWFCGAVLERELESVGLGRQFDVVAVSCETGWMKPHPEIFVHALRRLDAAPNEAVMIGDSLSADIAPAKLLGMHAVWKRNSGHTPQQEASTFRADAEISDLWELQRLPLLLQNAPPQFGARR